MFCLGCKSIEQPVYEEERVKQHAGQVAKHQLIHQLELVSSYLLFSYKPETIIF